MMRRPARFAATALFISAAIACTTVPVTGRRSLQLLPETQLAAMSVDSYSQVLSEAKVATSGEAAAMVQRVGSNIAGATEAYLRAHGEPADYLDWEFTVIEDDETVNAWALPGGKIAVYTGILPIAQNDTGLAVIIGHEIAHAIAGHANERVSQALVTAAGAQGVAAFMRDRPERTQQLVMQGLALGTTVGVMLPYSRLHEAEADRIGLILMAIAGYDPRAAIPFWQRMAAEGGERPPEFLSTHPEPSSRIENIRRYLPEAIAIYEQQRQKWGQG